MAVLPPLAAHCLLRTACCAHASRALAHFSQLLTTFHPRLLASSSASQRFTHSQRSAYRIYLRLFCGNAPLRRIANGLIVLAILYFFIMVPYMLSFIVVVDPTILFLNRR